MSDNIPFDIQREIIKKVSDVKTLICFRIVSKLWKSLIDSSEFIKGYGARHTQPHSFIVMYNKVNYEDEVKYFRLLVEDDNNETFDVKQQELAPAVVSPLVKQYSTTHFVGASHGLVCLHSHTKKMLVIWNPAIRKSFGIADHNLLSRWDYVYGFGVRPDTSDPTVVKIIQDYRKPWHVEVFTLSSGVWNVIPSSKLLRQSIELSSSRQGVVIHRFIYWPAVDKTSTYCKWIIVSFDFISEEFKVIDLPDSLRNEFYSCTVSKLRESLVLCGSKVEGAGGCDVWVMEQDLSFKKLFSIGARVNKILGFSESGEPIFETIKGLFSTLDVYDSCSQQISSLGIDGVRFTFNMSSYKESLLLLNHLDLHIYCDDN